MPGIRRRGGVLRLVLCAISTALRSGTLSVAENLCLRRSLSHRDRRSGRLIGSPGDIRRFGLPIGTAWPFNRPHRLEPFDPSVQLRIALQLQSQHRLVRIAVQPERGRGMRVRSSGRLLAIEQMRPAAGCWPTGLTSPTNSKTQSPKSKRATIGRPFDVH